MIQFVRNIFRFYSVLVLEILIVLVFVLVNEGVIISVLVFILVHEYIIADSHTLENKTLYRLYRVLFSRV